MINSVIFSPSGTTAKVARLLAESLGGDSVTYDLTVKAGEEVKIDADLVIFAMPVYAGRIPPLAAERLQKISGNGQKAVAVVVYGNRDYDDALLELCNIVSRQGFRVVAAAAFIAQHCIFPKVASGRPDEADATKISEFAWMVRRKCSGSGLLDLNTVKGKRPYKKAAGVPLHPDVDKDKCNSCGTCAAQCPTGAIDAADPLKTDGSKCITCCRCINVCPQDARQLGGVLYKVAGWKFVKDNSRRLEPEWFV